MNVSVLILKSWCSSFDVRRYWASSGKRALHLAEPGGAGRREVDMTAGSCRLSLSRSKCMLPGITHRFGTSRSHQPGQPHQRADAQEPHAGRRLGGRCLNSPGAQNGRLPAHWFLHSSNRLNFRK